MMMMMMLSSQKVDIVELVHRKTEAAVEQQIVWMNGVNET